MKFKIKPSFAPTLSVGIPMGKGRDGFIFIKES
jgi:hypothetical protein